MDGGGTLLQCSCVASGGLIKLRQIKGDRAMKLSAIALLIAATLANVSGSNAQSILKVGSTPTGIPFTFLDTKTNSIPGVMVDLVTEVGKDVGFQVQVEPMQFSTLIAAQG